MAGQPIKPKSSISDCPSNLKEAIDWMLRISNKDGQGSERGHGGTDFQATSELADALSDLFQKTSNNGKNKEWTVTPLNTLVDNTVETLRRTNGALVPCFEQIRQGIKELHDSFSSRSNNFFQKFKKNYDEHRLLNYVRYGKAATPINVVAESLGLLIGYNPNDTGMLKGDGIAAVPMKNGILQNCCRPYQPHHKHLTGEIGYVLSYPKNAKWSYNYADKSIYAINFLTAIAIIFPSIAFLYWKCAKKTDNNGWNDLTLDGNDSNELKGFFNVMGFANEDINNGYLPGVKSKAFKYTRKSNSGLTVLNRLKTVFPEFGTVYAEDDPFPKFIVKLVDRASDGTSVNNPLSECYVLTYAYMVLAESGATTSLLRTVGGVACAAGITGAAYASYLYGLIPAFTTIFA
ncbi:variant erythrocyte surface antigen-1, beta subunit [Babesia caballi]|uniref:Variant erythrocyte surface antigen-1, beta subunit n=1 Tax=Babesia caballi TaxID=5871 RepID=A0AAV4LSV6_BABCB|nr:variant erythrocyte surface antigen-1, beta subunit [Babesia caballi]